MFRHSSTLVGAAILAMSLSIGGCSKGDPASVSKDDVKAVQKAQQTVAIGVSKTEALNTFKYGNKVRLGSASIGGATIEEWKVEAYHDDDWNKTRQLVVTFLYFRNDLLVDVSDKRLPFRDDKSITDRWSGTSTPAPAPAAPTAK